ncbi:predicted protein [Naegleria gruberi]|uniref:Predicted protein n=1 Tax=Naegleria gruberi TaxID=5762 RepID=D2W130_NAEGR|nr:uncharacterized protein NAEGRDRAFT_75069 [Naegleria gruberi]EFC37290.1 predicted protein [Naegleria gruberi]|eukprot:XP_002670034.1 predicted protein [Naegleria gruberi strain NEG-M]
MTQPALPGTELFDNNSYGEDLSQEFYSSPLPKYPYEEEQQEFDDIFNSQDDAKNQDNQGVSVPSTPAVHAERSNILEGSNVVDQGLLVAPTTDLCYCQEQIQQQINLTMLMFSMIINGQLQLVPTLQPTTTLEVLGEAHHPPTRKTSKTLKRKAIDSGSEDDDDHSSVSSSTPKKKTKQQSSAPMTMSPPPNTDNNQTLLVSSGAVHNDIYVQFEKPLDKEISVQWSLYWSSKPTTQINEHAKVDFTFHPYDGTVYRLNILQGKNLIPYLKEHKQLPKKPSKPKELSEGGIYYLQVNSQLYQLYSKYNQKDNELDNTLILNSSTCTGNLSMQWVKQSNYTHKPFPTPTCQISSIISNDAN